jgi:carbon monoxide dehydrogenase subunit G
MTELKVEQSIWINAARERVWQALTQPELMMQWFAPNLAGMGMVMKQEADGKYTIMIGPMGIDILRLESSESAKQVIPILWSSDPSRNASISTRSARF